jgi:hypothetical protein
MKRIVNIRDGLILANVKQVKICPNGWEDDSFPHGFLPSLKVPSHQFRSA